MDPISSPKSYTCNSCGILVEGYEELLKHQIAIHINNMLQCQSCNKVFDTKIKFKIHATEIHGNARYATDTNSNSTMEGLTAEKVDNDPYFYEKRLEKRKLAKEQEVHTENQFHYPNLENQSVNLVLLLDSSLRSGLIYSEFNCKVFSRFLGIMMSSDRYTRFGSHN